MTAKSRIAEPVVGFDIPAEPGMPSSEIQTPALIVDLDAFEQNVAVMRRHVEEAGLRLRPHAKTHKSAHIALYQMGHGGAVGVCCQKVSEAEALVGAGVKDVLVSNEVADPVKIDRLAMLAGRAKVQICVDDIGCVTELSQATTRHGTSIGCLVEIEVGCDRCGVEAGEPAVDLAQAVEASSGLFFAGLQAYQGAAQHERDFEARQQKIETAARLVRNTLLLLKSAGLDCPTVTGGGTGTYPFETESGVYTELQCGSYIFMDADYQRVRGADGQPIAEFRNSLFLLTSVMSHAKPDKAVCDAGLKVQSVDSGLPRVFGRDDLEYLQASDEHGLVADPQGSLRLNDRLKLVPGHCDPTCNLHDWLVAVRGDRVEALWPVTARGLSY